MSRASINYEANKDRAAGVARHVSRLLREAGYPRAAKLETPSKWAATKNERSEGFVSHRIGYGSTVAVYYTKPNVQFDRAAREHCKDMERVIWEFLRAKGYSVDEKGWIETAKPY